MEYKKEETTRLMLLPFEKEDSIQMAKHLNNKKIYHMTFHIPFPYTKQNAIAYIEQSQKKFSMNQTRDYGIFRKKNSMLIGCISISFHKENKSGEVAYWIAEEFWNQGYATEALTLIIKNAFDRDGYQKLYAYCYKENKSSERIMMKNNMKFDGVLRSHILKENTFYDVNMFSILKEEYK